MKRREFLKMALATTSYLLIVGCSGLEEDDDVIVAEAQPTAVVDQSKRQFDLIVIGAGAAGLAAARTLVDEEYSIVVLEGRDRIGGRLVSDRSLGVPLDMGASWIHGIDRNPITDLAGEFGMEMLKTDYDEMVVYNTDGTQLNGEELAKAEAQLTLLIETIAEEVEELDEDVSIQQAVDYVIAGMNLSQEELKKLNYMINAVLEHEEAADISEMSTFHADAGEEFGGGDVLFPGGFDQMAKGLARGLDIRLSHHVNEIIYGDDGVTVRTDQGDFQADGAIVTLPLGVLQKGVVRFSPSLPADKQAAINQLGMGVLNKLYLRFPKIFWEMDAELLGYVGERKGEWAEFLNIAYYIEEPILLAFNAGRFGTAVEQLSDKEILAEVMKVLRTIYGADAPDPIDHLISRWHSDPYAYGSYSFTKIGSSPQDRERLAAPLGPLFFAGEATSMDHPSTVHGAYMSGLRAAAEAMAFDEEG